ncbi:hypothetical protein G7Y89_g11465 [Cudoniella acicularis]|uniref:Luciferase-like domain-containing protein n=1 Tax=Cudoniella acicularis TaxID=354080 RepID=A0A8H4RD69_9HELO|nr:hypothetical protein G7Y89_g11465 [Cudoniella acicularis]
MTDHEKTTPNGHQKKQILLNSFDLAAVGHTSIGQWKNPEDKSDTKHILEYWIELAKILPLSAMSSVTKNLSFGITSSTSFEPPFLLAKRFSTLDHMTNGRFAWNIVASWKKSAFRAIGVEEPPENDGRTTTKLTRENKAGADFASRHAEAIFIAGPTPEALRAKVINGRLLAQKVGRNPSGVNFFVTFTPILGHTDEEAQVKKASCEKYNSFIDGLVFFSGVTGIDVSTMDVDEPIAAAQSKEKNKVTSNLDSLERNREKGNVVTPRRLGEGLSVGGIGPLTVGSPKTVADEMERWMEVADLDGFNISHVVSPGSFEDVVELLIPELRRRGLYPGLATTICYGNDKYRIGTDDQQRRG